MLLRAIPRGVPLEGLAVSNVPVRYNANRVKKKGGPVRKVSPKEQKRREMLMLLGRSAMMDLENKPTKEALPYSYIQAKEKLPPAVISEEVEDYRARAFVANNRGLMALRKLQDAELRRAVASRLRALRELDKLSAELFHHATAIRLKELPWEIEAVPATPPIKGYKPPDACISE